jgi:uncharacterized protein YndB with AHSA1/START domain
MALFQIDKTIDISAPPEAVWKVLTDFAAYKQWNPFVVQARCDLKPGGAIDMQVKLKDKPQHQVEQIVAVQPGKGFSYRMKPMPLGALKSFRSHKIEGAAPGRSRYTSHFEIEGWLVPLVLKMFREGLEKGFAGMTDAVGRRAEQLSQRG